MTSFHPRRRFGEAMLLVLLASCSAAPAQQTATPASPPVSAAPADVIRPVMVSAEVITRFPHDPRAFTQGLIAEGDILFESTGQPGESQVRRVDLTTGRVLAAVDLPGEQFGEGLVRWRDQLISLTWQDGIAHRWDAATLRRVGESRYPGEGWGLTLLGDDLILSDGSDILRVLDPATFAERRRIRVTAGGRPLRQLNELEVIDGRIWANIWMDALIAVIDPATGQVTHAIDLRPLAREVGATDYNAVLNGIAFDPVNRRLFVTGKRWPTVFELRVPELP